MMRVEDLPIEVYAYDDDLIDATRRDGRPRMRVYGLSGMAVVLGRGSDPERELNLEACLADRVPFLKRYGGGCAVFLDPGNVIVSAVLPKGGITGNRKCFKKLSAWLVEGLQRAGVADAYPEGISDLAVGGRKVGGACIYRTRELLYYCATVLVEPHLEKVERYLKHPPREPAYRKGRRHRDFMAALAPSLWPGTPEDLAFALRQELEALPAFEAVEAVF